MIIQTDWFPHDRDLWFCCRCIDALVTMGVLVPGGDRTAVRRTAEFFLKNFEVIQQLINFNSLSAAVTSDTVILIQQPISVCLGIVLTQQQMSTTYFSTVLA